MTATDLTGELRHALRALRRSPAYTAAAVLTLALGIGASASVVSVASALFVRPLPFADEAHLVWIEATHAGPDGEPEQFMATPRDFVQWRADSRTLAQVEAMQPRAFALTGGEEPETVQGGEVSAGMFSLLGATPLLGRTFTEAEDVARSSVAVISHALWRRRFGNDPGAVGQVLSLDGEPKVVIGVMRAGFRPLLQRGDVWVPLGFTLANAPDVASRTLFVAGRRLPTATVERVAADLVGISSVIERDYPRFHAGWGAGARPLRTVLMGGSRTTVLTLTAAVAFLLLLACANVANLTLARVARTRAETSLRFALGASRWRIVRRQLLESTVLGVLGGALGPLIGAVVLRQLRALGFGTNPLLEDVPVDWRVAAAVVLLSVFAGVACAAVPSLHAARVGSLGILQQGGWRASLGVGDRRTRRLLMSGQIAAALVLLVGATMMLRVLRRLDRTDPGFDAAGVTVAQMTLPRTHYPNVARRSQAVERVLDELRAIPGVTAVGSTMNYFAFDQSISTVVTIEGRSAAPLEEFNVHFRRIAGDYFPAMRIPVLRGRRFTPADRDSTVPVAIVSQSMAERYWPAQDPLGKRLKRPGDTNPWLTVVGVVPDVMDSGLGDTLGPTLYLPYAQNSFPLVTLVIRSALPSGVAPRAVRDAVRRVDADQPVDDVAALETLLGKSIADQRLKAVLLALLASLGLALACTGISGVTAYLTAERTKEIGIRVALGAEPSAIRGMLLWDAARWIGLGVALGWVVTLGLAAAARGRLAEAGDVGVPTALAAGALLAAVALVAAYGPVRRATRLNPVIALREP